MYRQAIPGKYLKFHQSDWSDSDRDVPEHTQEMLENYVVHGLYPGSFGYGLLTNDLCTAVNSADATNASRLKAIVTSLFYALPADCWGNPEKVKAWSEDLGGRRTIWVQEREKQMMTEILAG